MTPEILEKYADLFLQGINKKLSLFLIEGREMFLDPTEAAEIKEIMKGWFIDFYNETNGQG